MVRKTAVFLVISLLSTMTGIFLVKSEKADLGVRQGRCISSIQSCKDALGFSVQNFIKKFYDANKFKYEAPFEPPQTITVKIEPHKTPFKYLTPESFSFEGKRFHLIDLKSDVFFEGNEVFLGKAFDTLEETEQVGRKIMREGMGRLQETTHEDLSQYLMGDVTPGVSYPFISLTKDLALAKSFAHVHNGTVKRKFGVVFVLHLDGIKTIDVEKFLNSIGFDYHDTVGIFPEDEVCVVGPIMPEHFISAFVVENDTLMNPRRRRDQAITQIYTRP